MKYRRCGIAFLTQDYKRTVKDFKELKKQAIDHEKIGPLIFKLDNGHILVCRNYVEYEPIDY